MLVTNQIQNLQQADLIVVMVKGRVKTSGNLDKLVREGVDFTKVMKYNQKEDTNRKGSKGNVTSAGEENKVMNKAQN